MCMCGPVLRRSPRLPALLYNWIQRDLWHLSALWRVAVVPRKKHNYQCVIWLIITMSSTVISLLLWPDKQQTTTPLFGHSFVTFTQSQLIFCWCGAPAAAPIRPRGVCSNQWWAPDDWRAVVLQAPAQSPIIKLLRLKVTPRRRGTFPSDARHQFLRSCVQPCPPFAVLVWHMSPPPPASPDSC